MPSAFFTGLSGLRSHARAVEVVANNLANLNTTAFKGSRTDFRDLFYENIGQSRSGVVSQVGIGVAPITVTRRFEQGTVQNTGGLLDAAIQGEGFFIVRDGELTQYTRAGNLQLNQFQELVTISGERVQGWNRNRTTGQVNTLLPIEDINLQGNDRIEPQATTLMRIAANIDTAATQPFARPIQVFDSLGSPHILTLVFTPVAARAGAASSFDVTVTIPAEDVLDAGGMTPAFDPSILATVPPAASGFPLDFDPSGNLIVPAVPYAIDLDMAQAEDPATATPAAVTFANGAADLVITWDLLDVLDQPTLTSVAAPSAVTDVFQNGTASAELISISISDGGDINGIYSDGRSLVLAKLALARFTNPQALVAVGNNNFRTTSAAGVPTTGPANTGGLGSIVGLSLESSNVDIAQEFVNLLTFQRGFQANSRVITTADELNQEALNLKR